MDAALYARAFFYRQVFIEAAGLFWIAAELAILFGVLLARRHLARSPAAPRLHLESREWRLAAAWAGVFALFTFAVLARHAWLPQAHTLIENGGAATAGAVARLLHRRHVEHLVLWSVFVAAWVGLEALIVYHGWRAYRLVRGLLRGTEPGP